MRNLADENLTRAFSVGKRADEIFGWLLLQPVSGKQDWNTFTDGLRDGQPLPRKAREKKQSGTKGQDTRETAAPRSRADSPD